MQEEEQDIEENAACIAAFREHIEEMQQMQMHMQEEASKVSNAGVERTGSAQVEAQVDAELENMLDEIKERWLDLVSLLDETKRLLLRTLRARLIPMQASLQVLSLIFPFHVPFSRSPFALPLFTLPSFVNNLASSIREYISIFASIPENSLSRLIH